VSSNDLDFRQSLGTPSATDLRLEFRTASGPAPVVSTGALRGVLGAPVVRARARHDLRVSRPTVARTGALWLGARAEVVGGTAGWRNTLRAWETVVDGWSAASSTPATIDSRMRALGQSRQDASIDWRAAHPVANNVEDHFKPLSSCRIGTRIGFERGAPIARAVTDHFVLLIGSRASVRLGHQTTSPISTLWSSAYSVGMRRRITRVLLWDEAARPRVGRSLPHVDPPIEPPPIFRMHPDLDFCCPATEDGLRWRPALTLNFTRQPCTGTGLVIPALRVYFVSNSVDVVRLPGREPIPVKSIYLSIDADSWAWGFTAAIPYSAIEMVEPTAAGPTEIEITINGLTWVMLVEGFDIRREFGSSEASIRGRSSVAWLADPYAPKRSFTLTAAFTARQLAELELERAGLITGFDLDWQLPDWLVPAGAWSYESLAPVQVIARLVESVGGTLNAHPHLRRLMAKSRYPSLPWEWSNQVAHRTLPIDVVKTLSARWQEKAAFNAVFVAGERQGLVARVVRSGTAGDLLAPMIVDPLITHADAARERGRVVLADVGRQARVTLELPMLPGIGLLDPGRLIAIGENGQSWRGLVRGTTVSASWSQSLIVRQTVEVERHLAY
jgi:hypothetical protein